MDLCLDDVMENADVPDAEPELWSPKVAQFLDSTSASLRGFVTEMDLDLVSDFRSDSGRQALEVDDSLRRENDLMTHSSQMIARIEVASSQPWVQPTSLAHRPTRPEIARLHRLVLSRRRIGMELGINDKTVGKALRWLTHL